MPFIDLVSMHGHICHSDATDTVIGQRKLVWTTSRMHSSAAALFVDNVCRIFGYLVLGDVLSLLRTGMMCTYPSQGEVDDFCLKLISQLDSGVASNNRGSSLC